VTTLAVDGMAGRLTVPFQRGADRLTLELTAGASARQADIRPYDFTEHIARFDAEPDPRYIVTTRRDVTSAVQLTVSYQVLQRGQPSTPGTATLTIPAGVLAGGSALLHLGTDEGPGVRLRTLAMTPPPDGATAADLWVITALLGTTAKLLWVVGAERDTLRTAMAQVNRQGRLAEAVGHTLDLIGFDLGIPRFPPQPYSVEDGTVALWHLDDDPGVPVQDATSLFGQVGHPSVSVTAHAGAAGRFGSGFAFADPGAEITVADDAEFALDPTASFTAESFVKPADGDWQGAVLSKHADPADPARPGWALSVGGFGRGIARNVGLLVSDGPHGVTLFADVSLTVGGFTHLAGVIDRAAGQARLYVDGVARAAAPITTLGAVTNAEPVRIGRAGSGSGLVFQGVIDEARLSRAARDSFHPVLGEDDDSYRRRLRIFQRWTLPTPASIQAALNDAAGEVAGIADPFVVYDQDSTLVEGAHTLTVRPANLAAGESIDDLGRRGTAEADVSGTADQDDAFDPELLADGSDPRAEFAPGTGGSAVQGGAAADPRRMRVDTRRAFLALLDLVAAQGVAGKLTVLSGYTPGAPDLRAVGRALIISHPDPNLPPGQLAVLAHRAGFSWVQHQAGQDVVYASVRSTATIEIDVETTGGTATPENGFDLLVGQTLTLAIQPGPPPDALSRWSTIACGAGRATFSSRTDLTQVTISAIQPGDLNVEAQVTRGARSFPAIRRLRVGLAELPAGQSISDSGALSAEAIAGDPADSVFDPAYLVTVTDPRVSFAAGANTHRMQPAVAASLLRLLDLVAGNGIPQITAAWDPGASGLALVGRSLEIAQGTAGASLARLGALAYAAGFTYVSNDGSHLQIRQSAGDLITVTGPDVLNEGDTAVLTLAPQAGPRAVALGGSTLWTANAGTDTVSAIAIATGRVIRAVKAGLTPVAVAASPDGSRAYSADRDGQTISVIDAATQAVIGIIALPASPVALAHHPNQPTLYAALTESRQVAEINTATLSVARTVAVTDPPVALAIGRAGGQLWVAADQASLRAVDPGSFTVTATVPLGGVPADVTATDARAYVTIPSGRALQVVDAATRSIQATFTDLGTSPGALAVAPGGGVLYVADPAEGLVYLRQADGSAQAPPAAPAHIGGTPVDVLATDDRAYVVCAAGHTGVDGVTVLGTDGSVAAVWTLGTGLGEQLTWSLQASAAASARLGGTTTPSVQLSADAAGPVDVHALWQWPDHTPPYTFEVRLNPALEAREQGGGTVIIRKDQYDLVMNVLNELHPIGVEVSTQIIREHVVELGESLIGVFPGYTFPDFRARGPQPSIVPIGQE
jgi:YVTN family beta-propeller protein